MPNELDTQLSTMKIYLDNCCFNRPFDDQSNQRVHLESEAIKAILSQFENGEWNLIVSDISQYEIANTPEPERRQKLQSLIKLAAIKITLTQEIRQRAKIFETTGIKAFDAMHLASAETHADIFLTVDDKLHTKARILNDLRIDVSTPLIWLNKVLQ
ncbi:MAG: PIN domain-containing protein [Chromatiaceae bacterium]|nr:PIN domain-containing protein [Chromatiaceae bacterium]